MSLASMLLKGGAKAAKATGKAAAKGAKKAGRGIARGAKKAAKKKVSKFKNKLKKMTGAGLIGSIGGMIGSLFDGGGSDEQQGGTGDQSETSSTTSTQSPTPTDDPTISFDGLAAAIAAAMPNLEGLDSTSNRSDANLASFIVRENIELPIQAQIVGDEIEGEAILPAGQFISARILELGRLWGVVDNIKEQVGLLNADLSVTNEKLDEIANALGMATDENRRTRRRNERRRDEEDTEEGTKDKEGFFSRKLGELKEVTKTGLLGMGTLVATGLGFVGLMAAGAYAVEVSQRPDEEGEEGTDVQETQEEAKPSPLDTAIETLDTGAVGVLDDISTAATVTALGASAASAMGVAGAATVAAAAVPIAAVTGAAALGYTAGTVLYEHTGLKEGIGSMIDSHLAGESLDIGAGSDPAAMKEKYGNKQGAELLGDLLGEGMLDMSEDPNDIVAFFRDNVKNMEDYNKLNEDYLEEYDRPITSALNDVLGTKGVESIFDVITANAVADIKEEKVKEVNGFKVRSIERPTELRGAEIGDPNQAIRTTPPPPDIAPVEEKAEETVVQSHLDTMISDAAAALGSLFDDAKGKATELAESAIVSIKDYAANNDYISRFMTGLAGGYDLSTIQGRREFVKNGSDEEWQKLSVYNEFKEREANNPDVTEEEIRTNVLDYMYGQKVNVSQKLDSEGNLSTFNEVENSLGQISTLTSKAIQYLDEDGYTETDIEKSFTQVMRSKDDVMTINDTIREAGGFIRSLFVDDEAEDGSDNTVGEEGTEIMIPASDGVIIPAEETSLLLNAGMEGRETGGRVKAGETYIVGEGGPEIFLPSEQAAMVDGILGVAEKFRTGELDPHDDGNKEEIIKAIAPAMEFMATEMPKTINSVASVFDDATAIFRKNVDEIDVALAQEDGTEATVDGNKFIVNTATRKVLHTMKSEFIGLIEEYGGNYRVTDEQQEQFDQLASDAKRMQENDFDISELGEYDYSTALEKSAKSMPDIVGKIEEKASAIIPIIMPTSAPKSTMKESAGNSPKTMIGSAMSSFNTSDQFLNPSLTT